MKYQIAIMLAAAIVFNNSPPVSAQCSCKNSGASESTCANEQGCVWDPSRCPSCIPCSDITDETECNCQNRPTCLVVSGSCQASTLCAHTDATSCNGDNGCVWDDSNSPCEFCRPCSDLSTESACNSVGRPYCAWDSGAGTCAANSVCVHTDEANCNNEDGCTWDDDTIPASPFCRACSDFGTESDCNCQSPNCGWDGSSCAAKSDCQYTTANNCNADNSCIWDDSNAACPFCKSCSAFTDEAGCTCGGGEGCQWTGASCVPNSVCQYTTSSTCTANDCAWVTGTCDSCRECSTFTDEAGCSCADGWCLWSGGSCASTSVCRHETQNDCTSNGCAWVAGANGVCDACIACSSLTTEISCTCDGGEGCLWDGSNCVANSNCPHGTETACINAANCGWVAPSSGVCGSCRDCSTFTQADCECALGCDWSSGSCIGDSTCEHPSLDDCADANCGWQTTDGSSNCEYCTQCSVFTSESDCECAGDGCVWPGATGACVPDAGGDECDKKNHGQCEHAKGASSGCVWMDPSTGVPVGFCSPNQCGTKK